MRRLSPDTNNSRASGLSWSCLTRPTKVGSRPATSAGVGYLPLAGQHMSEAYESVINISFNVRAGLVMRQAHHWAAVIFMAAIAFHMCRIFFTGAFRKPREANWLIGLTLLQVVMLEGFSGYSLPDDLLSGTGIRAVRPAGTIVLVGLGGIGDAARGLGGGPSREGFRQQRAGHGKSDGLARGRLRCRLGLRVTNRRRGHRCRLGLRVTNRRRGQRCQKNCSRNV